MTIVERALLQGKGVAALSAKPQTADEVPQIGAQDQAETVYMLLEHLVANGRVRARRGVDPVQTVFCKG